MAKSLLEALKAAQEKAGFQLIKPKPEQQPITKNPSRQKNATGTDVAVRTDRNTGVAGKQSVPHSRAKKRRQKKPGRQQSPAPSKEPPVWNNPRRPTAMLPPNPAPAPEVRLVFNGPPRLAWKPSPVDSSLLLERDQSLGSEDRLSRSSGTDRELIMGIDFGTSSTKVVISDRVLDTAYAVPFLDVASIDGYLLPSRLAEIDGVFTLAKGDTVYRDLKLSMLAFPEQDERCIRVCAFLALVIRSARAWLFGDYAVQYQSVAPLWSLALGQPADHATSKDSRMLFDRLGKVAWHLANQRGDIRRDICTAAWKKAKDGLPDEDVEILVMPELTAQIHGFVSSSHFNPGATNIYLLCDVGAGTVDASVFRVERTPSGSNRFKFFTHCVESHGVMNLHRHRVDWWDEQLGAQATGASVRGELDTIRLPTEYGGHTPACFSHYFEGVKAEFLGSMKTPDEDYFRSKVVYQVKGRVLYRLWNAGYLDQQNITGMPFFLCGGGARHPIYTNLKNEMQHQPNCTWLSAQHRALVQPPNLQAPGLGNADFDRLSVAYGLSQLDLDSVTQISPLTPLVACGTESNWCENYVDKDVC